MNHERGMGFPYRRPESAIWWIQYNVRGKRHRESSGSTDRNVAVRLLKKRIGEASEGRPFGHDIEKTKVADLVEMVRNDYRANNRRLRAVQAPLQHLIDYFGADYRAMDVTTDRITTYVTYRQESGAKAATINRSLAALKRGFTLAVEADKVARRPHISLLEENNARTGFLSHSEFERLCGALPEDLRDPVAFLYHSGWRVNEMRTLEWRDVDLEGNVIRLRPERSKSKKGRVLPLRGELADIIQRAGLRRIPACPFVFRRASGQPVGLFRKSWASACKAAGLGAVIVHDLRRCAIRNMTRAGVGEKVAMEISGHKTRSVFERYNIVTEDDLARAIEQTSAHLAAQPQTSANVVALKRVAGSATELPQSKVVVND